VETNDHLAEAQREITPVAYVSRGRTLCDCGRRRPRPGGSSCCIPARDTPIDTPDLAIYSQLEQLANNLEPSWDSPDIVTNDWGPFRLKPEASVKVRNLSATTPAVNGLVHYYTSPFGIGTRRTLRLSQLITLGPLQEVELLFPLHQEMLSGDPRTGVHIEIEHPTDGNLINNAGSQVHDGGFTTESGRSFTVAVPVVNDSPMSRTIALSLMATDLTASLSTTSHAFAPFEQINVNLHIAVPGFLHGTPASPVGRAVTVVGRLGGSGELVGGVTRLLRIDD
jgi:hypothetical protein